MVAVRGAEVALCWACSGLGRGTTHPGFNGNYPIDSPFSFLDSQLAKESSPKAFLKMVLAHKCLLEQVLGLALLACKAHIGHYLVEMSRKWGQSLGLLGACVEARRRGLWPLRTW